MIEQCAEVFEDKFLGFCKTEAPKRCEKPEGHEGLHEKRERTYTPLVSSWDFLWGDEK